MNRRRARAGIKGFLAFYAGIRKAVEREYGTEIREDEQPQWHEPAVVRLFKRLGAVPKSWSPQKAALRICIAAGEAAQAEKTKLESVFAVLKSFVAEQDGKGICVTVPRCTICPLRDRCAYVQ